MTKSPFEALPEDFQRLLTENTCGIENTCGMENILVFTDPVTKWAAIIPTEDQLDITAAKA